MRKQILDALKTKFDGVSESILKRVVDKIASNITEEGEIAQAVEAYSLQQLLESYGDSRATQAQRTAVANYERGLKDGQKVDGGEPQSEPNQVAKEEHLPQWAQELIESNKQLAEQLNAMNGERIAEGRRREVGEIIKALPEVYRRAYDRIDVTSMSEEEYAKLLDELPDEVEAIEKSQSTRGAVFGRPQTSAKLQSNANQATDEELSKAVELFN